MKIVANTWKPAKAVVAACFALGVNALGTTMAVAGDTPAVAANTSAVAGDTSNPPAPAARSDQSSQLTDIVVTAERHQASAQKTPIAMTAVGSDTLKDEHITNIEDLAGNVPNVNFSRNSSNARLFIRGVGLDSDSVGSEGRVAIYTDGVYNSPANAAFTSFFDVDRIEVLSGPQGTLYGRNATAGAINIITRDPTNTFEGYGSVGVGNYALFRVEGAVGGPITDDLSGRVAIQTAYHTGYGRNIETGGQADDLNSKAVRAKLKFEPTSQLTFLLSADYFLSNDHQGSYHYLGSAPGVVPPGIALGYGAPTDRYDLAAPAGPSQRLVDYGGSLTVTYDLGGPTLTSITGHREYNYASELTGDATASNFVPLYIKNDEKQFTQELRFADKIGPVDLLVGGYYFHEDLAPAIAGPFSTVLFGFPPGSPLTQGVLDGGSQRTTAYAFFTQETVHLTDQLGVDLGLRYSHEKRSVSEYEQNAFFSAAGAPVVYNPSLLFVTIPAYTLTDAKSVVYKSTDPKVTVHYQFTDAILAYATYSQGFKSGGFNIGYLQPAFQPERLKDYEVGLKADWFDHRLRTNFSAFYYDYTNLQINVVEGVSFVTRNAAGAKLHGVEADITVLPVDDLKISLNQSWVASKYAGGFESPNPAKPGQGNVILPDGERGFTLDGNELTNAPRYKVVGEVGYTFHTSVGDVTPRAEALWVERVYFTTFMENYSSQGPRGEGALFLDYRSPDKTWAANLFVRNVTNKYYKVSETVGSEIIGLQLDGQISPPRTYGVTVSKNF